MADGGRVVLRGRLLATRHALRRPQLPMVVTVNDFGLGSAAVWHPRSRAGYDFAGSTARRGVAWLLLDLAGYGRSTRVPGTATCLTAQAGMVDQAVSRLRHGRYYSSGPRPRAGRVVLWGQAVGGAVAEVAARDVPTAGLVVSSWSDSGPTSEAVTTALDQAKACQQAADGYAYFGGSRAQFEHLYFAGASQRVQDGAFAVREKDPCGDVESLPDTMAANSTANSGYAGPVLLAFGDRDAVTTPQGRTAQVASFSGATVTTVTLPSAGNAVTLEPGHRRLARRFVEWWHTVTG